MRYYHHHYSRPPIGRAAQWLSRDGNGIFLSGIGDLLIQSISARDYKLTQILILMFAVTYFVVNLLWIFSIVGLIKDQVLMFSFRYLKVWVGGAILAVLLVCGVAAPLLARVIRRCKP
jgi:hypothetical protein